MKRFLKSLGMVLLITGIMTSFSSCKKEPTLPVVVTAGITEITQVAATSGGEVTDNGGAEVIAKGVCWSASEEPTILDNKTIDGSGPGSFISNINSLTAATTYYIRAYASNSEGTAYGEELTFTTGQITMATLTTVAVTSVTASSAQSGGDITDDGGGTVMARGVCWSTSENPTVADSKTDEGPGIGVFTSNLTGLIPGNTYYARAYATNSAGTVYGSQVSFDASKLADIDGNEYSGVAIGTQVWLTENLKTTRYNDGTAISLEEDNTDWVNLTTPGYCWYGNNENNKSTYGAIYNWYAVNSGDLCPDGWHVATDADWTILENYLISNGYNYDGSATGNKIGKALAAVSGWSVSSVEGAVGKTDYPDKRNATGFSALPGGSRRADGTFGFIIDGSLWWTSAASTAKNAWVRDIYYNNVDLRRAAYSKELGCYVRCVRE